MFLMIVEKPCCLPLIHLSLFLPVTSFVSLCLLLSGSSPFGYSTLKTGFPCLINGRNCSSSPYCIACSLTHHCIWCTTRGTMSPPFLSPMLRPLACASPASQRT
ncbi:hypothetical protein F5883DRAFT_555224 [Diaporthe sp. PMI_573]|nr:hypothetical protein F5883DRAFT_555224 [Diaporthaceae sp. PMI_573]